MLQLRFDYDPTEQRMYVTSEKQPLRVLLQRHVNPWETEQTYLLHGLLGMYPLSLDNK
jgi:hypothetical protein